MRGPVQTRVAVPAPGFSAVSVHCHGGHASFHFSTATNCDGKDVYLRDIWPTREEIQAVEKEFVIPSMFREVYQKIEVTAGSF